MSLHRIKLYPFQSRSVSFAILKQANNNVKYTG